MYDSTLKKLAQTLNRAGIPYMIMGGLAVLRYGNPRMTSDIDVTIGVNTNELDNIWTVMKKGGFLSRIENLDEFVQKTMILPLIEPINKIPIDMIFSFSSFERDAIERGVNQEIGKQSIRFICPEDLIIQKIIAGRGRDLDDVQSILNIQRKLDLQSIEKHLVEFGNLLDKDYLSILKNILTQLKKNT